MFLLREGTKAPDQGVDFFSLSVSISVCLRVCLSLVLLCAFRLTNGKDEYILTFSSAVHRHGNVISRLVTAVAVGPTKIR